MVPWFVTHVVRQIARANLHRLLGCPGAAGSKTRPVEMLLATPELPQGAKMAMKGKRVRFDDETWLALEGLARDSKKSFEDLANEAFADLLKKHRRPTTLKEALRESARREPANDPHPPGSEPEPVESTGKRGVASAQTNLTIHLRLISRSRQLRRV